MQGAILENHSLLKTRFPIKKNQQKVGNQAIVLQLTLVIRTYGGLPGCHRNVGGNYSSIRFHENDFTDT